MDYNENSLYKILIEANDYKRFLVQKLIILIEDVP